jgi:hypothetical protein
MEMKMTMKSTLTSAVVALGIAATTVSAHAETDFSTLGGIPAEPMKAAEMDAVQGKAFMGVREVRGYLEWYDNLLPHPLAFNLSLPGVSHIYSWWQANPSADTNMVLLYFAQADPNALRLMLMRPLQQ